MSTTATKMCIKVLSLPKESRAEIAERILISLEEKADENAEKAWKAAIRRRHSDLRSGKAVWRPAGEVMRDAMAAIS